MKYLKKFTNISDYEIFKGGGSYILPNVSYIENDDVVMFNPSLNLNPDTWYATYYVNDLTNESCSISHRMNLIENLKVNGENINLEQNKNISISRNDFNIIETVVNEDLVMVIFENIPTEYFTDNITNVTLSPSNSESVLDKCLGIIMEVNFGGTITCACIILPYPISMLLGENIFEYDETNNSIKLTEETYSNFIGDYNPVMKEQMVLCDINFETFEGNIADTNCNIIYKDYKFKNIGEYNVELILNNKTLCPDYMFLHCSSLLNITLPNDITYIGKKSFNSTGINSFIMPNSVSELGECVFMMSSIGKITFSENIKSLPGSTSEPNEGFFSFCSGLESITLPENINYIGVSCFCYCSLLKSIRCESTTAPYFDETTTFLGIPSTGTLYYPAGSDYSTWKAALPSGWTYVEF